MTELQSILLGIIQGITEFLPVSSSGHLAVASVIFGVRLEASVLYTVLLHVATLCAVVLVFRKRIGAIIVSLWRGVQRKAATEDKANLRLLLILILATAATVIIALVLYPVMKQVEATPKVISVLFVVTGIILLATCFFKEKTGYGKITYWQGLVTGVAQGIGVFPGISRSGITISTALAAGVERGFAGEVSFLLSIPAILGALVFELKDAGTLMVKVPLHIVGVGFLAAFVTGILSLVVLLKIIKSGKLFVFSFYLIPLGIVTFFLI
jgi:undecaprenyl-diphosphatase